MFPPFISDAKDKHPTFTFNMEPKSFSDAKENHLFLASYGRMLPSDAKDKTPDIYFYVIWSRMFPPFVSDKEKTPDIYF